MMQGQWGITMRSFGKWLGRLLLALVLAAVVVGLWKREEKIGRAHL